MEPETARSRLLAEQQRLEQTRTAARDLVGAPTEEAPAPAATGVPGAGALYKHFASKRALLEGGVGDGAAAAPPPGELADDPGQALRAFGSDLLAQVGAGGDLLRIQVRDLEARPDLLGAAEARLAAWLARAVVTGELRDHDHEAVARLLVGALVHGALLDALVGSAADDAERQRLIDAWVDLALSA